MSYFVIQNFFYLMLTGLIGVLAGWLLKKHTKKKQYHEEYLALERERDELNKRMRQAEENMDRRYYLMTSDNQKINDQLSRSHSDNLILSKKIQSLTTELVESQQELSDLQESFEHQEVKLTSTLNEIKELQQTNEKLAKKTGLPALKTQIHVNQSNANSDQVAKALLQHHDVTALHQENIDLKNRLTKYTQQNLDITNVKSQLNVANKERQRLLSNQGKSKEKDDQIELLKRELSTSQYELLERENELSRYKAYLIDEEKKLVAAVESSTEKLAIAEKTSTSLQDKHQDNLATIEKLEATIAQLSQANSDLQAQLTNNETEHAALKKDHNKQKYQIEQLSAQVRKLTAPPEDN